MAKKEYTVEDIFRLVNRPGNGYIYKRKRRYGYSFHYFCSVKGKNNYYGFGKGWTYEEIYREISRILRKRTQRTFKLGDRFGMGGEKSKKNFDAVFAWFLTAHDGVFSKAKLYLLRYAGKKFSEFLRHKRKASAPIEEIDHALLEQYRAWMSASGLSRSSVEVLFRRLRLIFAAAVRAEKISNFPF